MSYTSRHYEVALEGQTKTVTPSETSQTITPDSGKKLTSVTVEAVRIEDKIVEYTANGSYLVMPSVGYVISNVEVTVNLPTYTDLS